MKRNDRLIILGCIYLGIAIACCIAGMIALGNDRIDAGFVLMSPSRKNGHENSGKSGMNL